jgi:hypothetical protein
MDRAQVYSVEGTRMTNSLLFARLRPVVRRQRRLQLLVRLAACWAAAAVVGLGLLLLQRLGGVGSPLVLPVLALAGLVASLWVFLRHARTQPDLRAVAQAIERRHPELARAAPDRGAAGAGCRRAVQLPPAARCCARRSNAASAIGGAGPFPAGSLAAPTWRTWPYWWVLSAVLVALRVPPDPKSAVVAAEAGVYRHRGDAR